MTRSMPRALALLMVLSLTLAACGGFRDSRVNPRNWFGGSSSSEPTLGPNRSLLDDRPLVPQVSALSVERTSSGAIVRAEAVMPTAGYFRPALVAENDGRPRDGVITYRFVAEPPVEPVSVNAPGARTISAAATLSSFDLEVIREVVVVGAQNTRRTRR